MKLVSSRPSFYPPKGFRDWFGNAILRPQPGPGICEGRILTSQVITSRTRQKVLKRALALTWTNSRGPMAWWLPQVIPLGQAGTDQRAQAIQTVREILWAGGHECADPLVLTAENLKGIRAGLVLVEVPHWHHPGKTIVQVERFMIHL